ncbi:MAG: DUF192 domain-containing protein [Phycisphaerales bacterium]|nr:DUF192 domain-containing protein [Phycisphaerales bacterium]
MKNTRLVATLLTMLSMLTCGCAEPMTHTSIVVNGKTWSMELAIGEADIRRGLMGRESLPPDTGMLFIFPRPDYHSFWMAWCVMPIDLVFLDGRGRVVATWEMPVEPPIEPGEPHDQYLARMTSYPSGVPVRFAAEFPAGTIESLHITRGDRFEMDIKDLLQLEQRRR